MSKQRMSQDISVQVHFDGPPQTSLCLSTVNINMSTTSFQMDFQLTVISFELILFLKYLTFIVFGFWYAWLHKEQLI